MNNGMNGETKPVMVRKLGTGRVFRLEVAPDTTAENVLTRIGAPAPR